MWSFTWLHVNLSSIWETQVLEYLCHVPSKPNWPLAISATSAVLVGSQWSDRRLRIEVKLAGHKPTPRLRPTTNHKLTKGKPQPAAKKENMEKHEKINDIIQSNADWKCQIMGRDSHFWTHFNVQTVWDKLGCSDLQPFQQLIAENTQRSMPGPCFVFVHSTNSWDGGPMIPWRITSYICITVNIYIYMHI